MRLPTLQAKDTQILFKEWEKTSIKDEYGSIETSLSNGWTVKQRFDWYVDSDGLHVVYSGDEMEVIGAEGIDEYSAEELAVLDECVWDTYDIEREIAGTEAYEEAVENFRDSLDPYGYYGVREKDFLRFHVMVVNRRAIMSTHRAVYLTRGKAAALYSVLAQTILNDQLLIGELNWALENQRWFSTVCCNTFADFVQVNNIQIVDEYLVHWDRCRWSD